MAAVCDQSESDGPKGSAGIVCRDDLLAQGRDGHSGELEVSDPQGNSDDGQAEKSSSDKMRKGHPQSDQKEPDDVADRGQRHPQ